jgi:thymidylate synthase
MNLLDEQYKGLLFDIIEKGIKKDTRNGKTRSIFGKQIRHKMSEGFPLLTTKKMYWKGIVTELLWFLRGDTNIKYLIDNNCHIWDGDAYKAYEKWYENMSKTTPFEVPKKLTQDELIKAISLDDWHAKQFGELGPIYGKQWRYWGEYEIDQITNLIDNLKQNPDSRRLMVTAWNPDELPNMVLPPCHYGFQVYTRPTTREEKIVNPGKYHAISLMWNQRSVDTFLGLPFNIASYGLLLEIIAKMANMVPDELIGNLGDVHLYENHIPQACEQITRNPYKLPELEINPQYWVDNRDLDTHILSMFIEDFQIKNYNSHPTIKALLSN